MQLTSANGGFASQGELNAPTERRAGLPGLRGARVSVCCYAPERCCHEASATLEISWLRKPLSSAQTETSVLPDGRIKLWIRHDVLHGVTPKMLSWWFRNIEGDIEIAGQRVPRYRAWHPMDHIEFQYDRRCDDGSIGPGAVFHIHEAFARLPRRAALLKRPIKSSVSRY